MIFKDRNYKPVEIQSWETCIQNKRPEPQPPELSKVAAVRRCSADETIKYALDILPSLHDDIAIVIVPPHHPEVRFSGIRLLAKLLLANSSRIDGTKCLQRIAWVNRFTTTILPNGHWAKALPRSYESHLSSIKVHNPELLLDKAVLLIDDKCRTGESIMACRDLLLRAGVREVQPFVLVRVTPRTTDIS